MAKKPNLTTDIPPFESTSELVECDRTVLETAAELRCSPSTVYRLINSGEITAYKRGDRTIIFGDSILAMKMRNIVKPGTLGTTVGKLGKVA
jgi:excisionase family DNA binding protein